MDPYCLPGMTPKPHKAGKKTRLLSLDDLDRRTRAAQHALDLRDRIISERGGQEHIGAVRAAMAQTAAIASVMIADMEARYLKGEQIDVQQLTALMNARRREAEAIGLDVIPRDVTPSLAEIIQEHEQ